MTDYIYQIYSEWPGLTETPVEVGRKFLQALDAFDRIDPVFGDWGTLDDEMEATCQPIAPLRPNFTAFVEANVARDDWDQPDPDRGYLLFASTHVPPWPKTPSTLTFLAWAGARSTNHSSLSIGSKGIPADLAIVTYPLFKSALLAMLAIWPAPTARAYCFSWGQKAPTAPGEPPFPGGGRMPWLAYFNAERAARFVPPHDILTERTPDGGLLMIATEARLDPTNAAHMKQSRRLAEIMLGQGSLY
jgi:hypothetical protein